MEERKRTVDVRVEPFLELCGPPHSVAGWSNAMGRRQQWVYHVEPSRFPPDFPERLQRFREAAGLSWRGLARRLRVRVRSMWRWRAGTQPDAGHLYALFNLAAEMGLLHHLLPAVDC